MSEELKRIFDSVKFTNPEAQKIYDFYNNSMRHLSNEDFEYENLIETSNLHHDAVYDYLNTYGTDDRFRQMIKSKYEWIKMIANKNNIEL